MPLLARMGRGLAVACAVASLAHAQTVQQAGPWRGGHVPSYSSGGGMSSPFVTDGGPAGGGSPNPVQEQELVVPAAQGGVLPPWSGTGTGAMGANWCDYDAPLTSASGYHFLCLSPNGSGNAGVIDYGAANGAAAQPLYFYINGISYNLSQGLPTFAPNSVLVTNSSQTLWSTTLPTALNLQTPSAVDLANATLCSITSCVSGLGTGVAAALAIAPNAVGGFVTANVGVAQGGTGDTTFSSNNPLIGNGTSAIAQGTVSGNTTEFATVTGSLTNGHCVSINGGNFIDAGGACTTGGGGGTVSAGTIGQLATYAASGTTITGTFAPNFPATGLWYQNNGASLTRLNDQVLMGGATAWSGNSGLFSSSTPLDWLSTFQSTLTPEGGSPGGLGAGSCTFAVLCAETPDGSSSASGAGGALFAAQSLFSTNAGTSSIGVSSIVVNNNTTIDPQAWAFYGEAHCVSGRPAQECIGMELDPRTTINNGLVVGPFQQGLVVDDQLGCGAGVTGGQNCDVAVQIVPNPNPFKVGINFLTGSLYNDPTYGEVAIAMAAPQSIQWRTGTTLNGTIAADSSGNILFDTGSGGSIMIDGILGVSCPTGINSSTFRSLAGIVTHC